MLGLLLAVLALVALLVAWVAVQRAWHRAFADDVDDVDALASRGRCQGCICSDGICQLHWHDGDDPDRAPTGS